MLQDNLFSSQIANYCHEMTSAEPKLLSYLVQETQTSTHLPKMLCGRIEGRFLKMLVQLSQAKFCVEIGTFTGYSALSIAEALPSEGKLITCEIRAKHAKIAEKYIKLSPHGHKIDLRFGHALETLKSVTTPIDFCFIDGDKINYANYYKLLLPKLKTGGLMVFDNALYAGEVLKPTSRNARGVHALNQLVQSDSRVEQVLLTVREGILLVRKK